MSGSGRLIGFLASGLLRLWAPTAVAGQDADAYDRSPSREVPRFTVRQIVTRSNDSLRRVPAPWQSAMEAQPESLARARYHTVARLSGVAALPGKALESQRFQHTMGLYHGDELTSAAARTLEAIRSSIPGDTVRARFDRIFRWRGNSVVDLHDAALVWAQTRSSGMTWSKARPATGYDLVAALAATLDDAARTARLLLSHAEHPADIARLPELRRAWKKYGGERDRMLPAPPRRVLIPEVTFTVEDGYPDVVVSRILVPASRRGAR